MQQTLSKSIVLASVLFIISCAQKNTNTLLTEKKTKLEELRKQQTTLNNEITKLENEISSVDTSAHVKESAKLVSVVSLSAEKFDHFVDLQGKIEAVNIAFITPRGQGGQVKELFVKKGDVVKKGQLILKLDDAVYKRQLDQLQTQLNFAKDIAQRQQNLWKENIGTEVQVLQSKNNVENLEKQISLVKEQQSFTNVYAEFAGVIDDVNVKVGELFMGAGQIKLVNTSDLKVTAQVPENYIGRIKEGTHVKVSLPDINKNLDVVITVAGKLIDALSRSFYVEAKLPFDNNFRPNQVAQLKLLDYANNNAIAIPANTLQTDEKGKFVLIAISENGKMVAHKKAVVAGELYGDKIEIKSGLQAGDKLITDGFQNLYEGQIITTDIK